VYRGTARVIFEEIASIPGAVDKNRVSECMISIRPNTVAVLEVLPVKLAFSAIHDQLMIEVGKIGREPLSSRSPRQSLGFYQPERLPLV
jgi:hypothetical protein